MIDHGGKLRACKKPRGKFKRASGESTLPSEGGEKAEHSRKVVEERGSGEVLKKGKQ